MITQKTPPKTINTSFVDISALDRSKKDMSLMTLAAVIVGAVEGVLIHRVLGMAAISDASIVAQLSPRDVVVIVIGLVQVFLGGRIHAAVRNAGYGVLAWQVGHELAVAGVLW